MPRLALLSLLLFATPALGAQNDLSVAWISRLPRIDYVWNSSNPTRDGWPAEGSTVTWVANVRWLGSDSLNNVSYRWTIDGIEVRHGTLDFAPGSLVQAELPWTWTFTRHQIAFEIDSARKIAEVEERNNRVTVDSDAIAIGLYVERTFWNALSAEVAAAGIGGTTFDDWMQREVLRFNDMARYAVWPETPDGVHERWRVDEIHLVEDGTLPLAPPYSEARDWGESPQDLTTTFPNVLDHTVDVQWGFTAVTSTWWHEYPPNLAPWVLTIGNSMLHEWAHARSMIDVYAWNLTADWDNVRLDPAPRTSAGGTYYNAVEQGMMNMDWGHIDRYTAAAMNRMAGRRATRGNYNEPWDLGWFLTDLPAQNRVRLLRLDGTPIANRKVTVYRATGEAVADWLAQPYAMTFDQTTGRTLTTDSDGRILVGHNPFSDGAIFAFVEKSNGTAIIKIEDGDTLRWAYLESLQFNLAYWTGHTDLADYDVTADPPACRDLLGPGAVEPLPEALVTTREVKLSFTADSDVAYNLYWTVNGGSPTEVYVPALPKGGQAELTLSLPEGRIVWWFVDAYHYAHCPSQHSSLYVFDHKIDEKRHRAISR